MQLYIVRVTAAIQSTTPAMLLYIDRVMHLFGLCVGVG